MAGISNTTVLWEIELGDLVVGAATLLLALGTFLLARSSSKSLEALDLPFVIATPERGDGAFELMPIGPVGHPPDEAGWALSVELANLGAGPGIVELIEIHETETGGQINDADWEVDEVLAKGQTKDVGIPLREAPPSEGTWLSVDVYYRSASGRSYKTIHKIRIARNQGAVRRTFRRVKLGRRARRRLLEAASER
jgi:hypothetical protein